MRIDRKRLKSEKLALLNHTKDLYKTIESKELEIRDILTHFDQRTRETSSVVKKLMDDKSDLEKEKNELQLQLIELIDEKVDLNLKLESKQVIISKLQKQLFEVLNHKTLPPSHKPH